MCRIMPFELWVTASGSDHVLTDNAALERIISRSRKKASWPLCTVYAYQPRSCRVRKISDRKVCVNSTHVCFVKRLYIVNAPDPQLKVHTSDNHTQFTTECYGYHSRSSITISASARLTIHTRRVLHLLALQYTAVYNFTLNVSF